MREREFADLMSSLGRESALAGPALRRLGVTCEGRAGPVRITGDALSFVSAKNWEQRLTAMDVPRTGVWAISQIVHYPHLAHRDARQEVPSSPSSDGVLTSVGSGQL